MAIARDGVLAALCAVVDRLDSGPDHFSRQRWRKYCCRGHLDANFDSPAFYVPQSLHARRPCPYELVAAWMAWLACAVVVLGGMDGIHVGEFRGRGSDCDQHCRMADCFAVIVGRVAVCLRSGAGDRDLAQSRALAGCA